ncbi:hypothetical protein [Devosia sp. LC5]|uniref:hypothetical protein n=1 Tax=Devosia sp. LC5 TaxID=1502724 RepID=UPI001FCB0205|nr:hypothetical protein [Devosia sp. LC5]
MQGLVKLLNLDPVERCHVRMQQGRRLDGIGEEGFQFLLAAFEADHLVVDPIGGSALQD